MKIYTKTGDKGSTSLYGGKRVSKSDLRINAYGTMDELNSWMGMLRDQEINKDKKDILIAIQNKLFVIGSLLAAEPGNTKLKLPSLAIADIQFLEQQIDTMDAILPPMRYFILPGGHPSVSVCHVTRTVCRRGERLVIELDQQAKVDPLIIQYLNRLSDFLFVLARAMGHALKIEETPWLPAENSQP